MLGDRLTAFRSCSASSAVSGPLSDIAQHSREGEIVAPMSFPT